MTTLGKLLIGIQFFFSLCFLVFAGAVYNAQINWREKAENFQADIQRQKNEFNALDKEFGIYQDEMETKLTEQTVEADKERAAADTKTKELEEAMKTVVNIRQERDTALEQADIASEEAENKYQEAVAQQIVNKKHQIDLNKAASEIQKLIAEKYNLETELEENLLKHERLVEKYTLLQEILANNDIDPDPEAHKGLVSTPPVVGGLVLDTKTIDRNNTTFVELSIGSDDGLAIGHDVFVYRQQDEEGNTAKYLGKLEIVRVSPDRAVGKVVVRAKNGIVQRGDNVTTKL